MPLSKYDGEFGGKPGAAEKAHASMVDQYGPEKGEHVFYATKNANKKKHRGRSARDGAKALIERRRG